MISQTRVTDEPEDQANTVGQPLPQLEVKIADPVTDEPTPLGGHGEICCRGYQNVLGYYALTDETAATIDGDGWLHLGDIGSMDERGYLKVTGRIKDMIRAGHGGPSVDELTVFLRGQLAPHKTPVFWAFRDHLPMTPSGKIQMFVLREEVVTGLLVFDEVRPTTGPRASDRPVRA